MTTGEQTKHAIGGLDAQGRGIDLELTCSGRRPVRVVITGAGIDLDVTGEDLFAALVVIRLQLEAQGVRLLISAARRDAWPGSSDRLFDNARTVWLCSFGADGSESRDEACSATDQPTRQVARVDALLAAPSETVGTVEEQRRSHQQWLIEGVQPTALVQQEAHELPNGMPVDLTLPATDCRSLFTRNLGWWLVNKGGELGETFYPHPRWVEILEADGRLGACEVLLSRTSQVALYAFGAGLPDPVIVARNAFAALGELRRALEARGARLLCEAARKDVWRHPLSARLVTPSQEGSPANEALALEALSPAPANAISTVDEQCAFHAGWLRSLDPAPDKHSLKLASEATDGFVHVVAPDFPDSQRTRMSVRGSWPVKDGAVAGEFVPNPYFRQVELDHPVKELDAEMDQKLRARLRSEYRVPEGPYPLDGR